MNKIRRNQGFSLIEIMIVVAILGIVAAIAVPSYMDYVQKGKRADAKVELLRLAQMQESYFVQNMSYASTLAQLGLVGTVTSEQGEYVITLPPASLTPNGCGGTSANACTGFSLNAAPQGSQIADTGCGAFTLSNTGARTVSGYHTAQECW